MVTFPQIKLNMPDNSFREEEQACSMLGAHDAGEVSLALVVALTPSKVLPLP